ncbi:unnamed protein product [Cercopithifilaria johnstoni]|uniref:PDZ domain-containing protein n=1 Tax=Cercopithifilaria johnstoni TaxID=2874296 RepID=A0A8J2MEC0_9BILA|nr:unnamed protein product [Cercopithifilaria johnstoni]
MDDSKNGWSNSWNHIGPTEIVYIDQYGAAANLAFVGDTILSIDNIEIHDSITLEAIMQKSTTRAFVKLRRNAYSHCRRIQSTVETLKMKSETKLLRAVNVYRVCIHAEDMLPQDENDLLGLSISYDARERLQVASTGWSSLAAIHLRPGDTIKEVNHHPVASKTMLQYWMSSSMEKNGFVELLIHSNVDQNIIYDELEMPEDVVIISAKQIAMIRTMASEKFHEMKRILRKNQSFSESKRSVSINNQIIEFPIASDYDPKQLRKSQKGQEEDKT